MDCHMKAWGSHPSQGTVNGGGGAVSKWPCCRLDLKHNQPSILSYDLLLLKIILLYISAYREKQQSDGDNKSRSSSSNQVSNTLAHCHETILNLRMYSNGKIGYMIQQKPNVYYITRVRILLNTSQLSYTDIINFNTVFDLITAPALITAPNDFLLYFHLLWPTWQSFSWLFTLFSLIIAHLTIFWH